MSDSTREGFFHHLAQNPDDDEARLVFSDWFEENGELDRAQFIRLQVERSQLPTWDAKGLLLLLEEEKLLEKHEEQWRAELPTISGVTWGEFRRGFIATASFTHFEQIKSSAEKCWAATPLETISIRWPDRDLPVEALPPIPGLRELELKPVSNSLASTLETDEVHRLAESPLLSTLRGLNLNLCRLTPTNLSRLLTSVHLESLKELNPPAATTLPDRMDALLESRLSKLESLNLSAWADTDPELIAQAMEKLAEWPVLSHINRLNLDHNNMSVQGIETFLRSPHLRNLEVLSLRQTQPTGLLLDCFEAASPAVKVEVLDVGANHQLRLTSRGLQRARCLRELKVLVLDRCELLDEDAEALADAPCLKDLRMLNLSGNHFSAAGIRRLFRSELPQLHTLSLADHSVESEAIHEIARSPALNGLLALDLSSNRLDEKAIDQLGTTDHFQNLRILGMDQCEISDQSARDFLASPLASRLDYLDIHRPDEESS